MIRKNSRNIHSPSMYHSLVRHCRKSLMRMNKIDAFRHDYLPQLPKSAKDCRQCCSLIHCLSWHIIHFQPIRQVHHSAIRLFFSFICMCIYYNSMTFSHQLLRKLVNVTFHPSNIWVKKVRYHEQSQRPIALQCNTPWCLYFSIHTTNVSQ